MTEAGRAMAGVLQLELPRVPALVALLLDELALEFGQMALTPAPPCCNHP